MASRSVDYAYQFSQLDQVMALYKYFAKRDRSALPTVHMCRDSFLSGKEVERANEVVKRVIGDANQDKNS